MGNKFFEKVSDVIKNGVNVESGFPTEQTNLIFTAGY